MRSIRVLVVDDSATMRSLISLVLRRDPMLEVVGEAGDPLEARQAIKALNPDVVTLDVEMPNMNGLEFLEKIMRLRPTPVIMVSNLTALGTSATIKALEIGAFDCIAKPSPGDEEIFDGLAAKVRAAAGARMRPAGSRRSALREKTAIEAAPKADSPYCPDRTVVAIGSSTGGVEALIAVLSVFPANCPPTVITQHMPATSRRASPNVSTASASPQSARPLMARALRPDMSIWRRAASPILRSWGRGPCGAAFAKAIPSTGTGLRSMCFSPLWRKPLDPMRLASS